MEEKTLREFRKDRKLNQTQFAQTVGYTQPYISKIEEGAAEITEELMRKLNEKYPNELKGIHITNNVKGSIHNSHNSGGTNSQGDNRNNTIIPDGFVSKTEADALREVIAVQKKLIEQYEKASKSI